MRIGLLATAVLVACGPSGRDNPGTDAPSQPDAPKNPDGPPVDVSRIYAHSGTTLYQMNNLTLAETVIGQMTGLGTQSLTDLAVDKDDNMVGITLDKLVSVDKSTGATTLIKDLSQSARNFTSLSFIPQTLNDPNSPEILVAVNSFGEVFQIDRATGNGTQLGDYGLLNGMQIGSSGDLFAVHGAGIFATVDVGGGGNDFLARIDPSNGWQATVIGPGTGFDRIFGLGFWGGIIYGFVDEGATGGGKMIQIDQNTGVGLELSHSTVRWFGAGVATDAPIVQ
jgi:hypothetical protein